MKYHVELADDIGNPGPDFRHGWGEVNAYRAVRMIENGHHFDGSISESSNNTHTINVPANLSRVKVMVYWHDKGKYICIYCIS